MTAAGAVSGFVPRRVAVLRRPYFRLLFLAGLASMVGNWLAVIALQVDVYDRTHSGWWVGALLLFGRWLDLWLMTMPGNFPDRPIPDLFELAGVAGPLALGVFWVTRTLRRVPMVAKNDPYLVESLHHHT